MQLALESRSAACSLVRTRVYIPWWLELPPATAVPLLLACCSDRVKRCHHEDALRKTCPKVQPTRIRSPQYFQCTNRTQVSCKEHCRWDFPCTDARQYGMSIITEHNGLSPVLSPERISAALQSQPSCMLIVVSTVVVWSPHLSTVIPQQRKPHLGY